MTTHEGLSDTFPVLVLKVQHLGKPLSLGKTQMIGHPGSERVVLKQQPQVFLVQVVPRPHFEALQHESKDLVKAQLASLILISILIPNNRVGSAAAVLCPTLAKRNTL